MTTPSSYTVAEVPSNPRTSTENTEPTSRFREPPSLHGVLARAVLGVTSDRQKSSWVEALISQVPISENTSRRAKTSIDVEIVPRPRTVPDIIRESSSRPLREHAQEAIKHTLVKEHITLYHGAGAGLKRTGVPVSGLLRLVRSSESMRDLEEELKGVATEQELYAALTFLIELLKPKSP